MPLSPVYTTTVDLSTGNNNAVVVSGISSTSSQLTATSFLSGPSAYQVALANGFVGTQAQWLASLVGPAGTSTNVISQPTQTSNFTAVANSFYPVNPNSAAVTATLPTSQPGQELIIKNVGAAVTKGETANVVFISGTINGTVGASIPVRTANQAKHLIANQSGGWNIDTGDIDLTVLNQRYSNVILTVSTITANTTAVAGTKYKVNATSAAITVTLPATNVSGQRVVVQKSDTSVNLVNITGTIDGVASTTNSVRTQNQGKIYEADGTGNWIVVAGDVSVSVLDARYAPAGASTSKSNITIGPIGSTADYIVTTTDADVTIQSAVNAAAGKYPVFVLPGTYLFAHPVSLPKNTIIRGAGRDYVNFRYDTNVSESNFSFNYLVNGRAQGSNQAGIDCIVSDINFDANTANYGTSNGTSTGLLEYQNGWIVERCGFGGTPYFRNWVNGVSDAVSRNNIYYGTDGASGHHQDSIGGGTCDNFLAFNNVFTAELEGLSVLDHVNSVNSNFIFNRNYSTKSIYIEGGEGWNIDGNKFTNGGQILFQSDAGYSATDANGYKVTSNNVRNSIISNNYVLNAGSLAAIKVAYTYGSTTLSKGGNNKVIGNTVISPAQNGILMVASTATPNDLSDFINPGDIITDNNVLNANSNNPNGGGTQSFTGTGTVQTSGIAIAQGLGVTIGENNINDNRSTPLQQYGIYIGQSYQPSVKTEPNKIQLLDNQVSGYVVNEYTIANTTYTNDVIIKQKTQMSVQSPINTTNTITASSTIQSGAGLNFGGGFHQIFTSEGGGAGNFSISKGLYLYADRSNETSITGLSSSGQKILHARGTSDTDIFGTLNSSGALANDVNIWTKQSATSNTDIRRVTVKGATGWVGINTSNPTAPLEVDGAVSIVGDHLNLDSGQYVSYEGATSTNWRTGLNNIARNSNVGLSKALQAVTSSLSTEGFQVITGAGVPLFEANGDGSLAFIKGMLSVNNNRITNVATPTATGDAANKSYVDAADNNKQSVLTTSAAQTTSFTAAANKIYTTSGTLTATLPTSTASQWIVIKKTDAIGTTTTVSYTLAGATTTLPLTTLNQAKLFYADGAGGWIVVTGDLGLDQLRLIFGQLTAANTWTAANTFNLSPTIPTPTNATDAANKQYVDTAVTGTLNFKGSTDTSANPNYPSAKKGDVYIVSVAGRIGGASGPQVDVGDEYFAIADNAGGTQAAVGASWDILEHNLVGALLAANNLSDLVNSATARTNLGLGTAATQNKVAAGTAGVLDATDPTTTNSRTPTGTAGGRLSGSYPNPTLASSGVTAASYTNANITVSADGTITAASSGSAGFANPMTTQGDLIYENATPAPARLAAGTANQVLHSGTTPVWGAVDQTADITGVTPVANGGTGSATKNFVDLTTAQTIAGIKTLSAAAVFAAGFSVSDAQNIAVGNTTGTVIGTATTQKLGFFNATPVVQQTATSDLGVALSNLGFRVAGTAYPITTSGAITGSGQNIYAGKSRFGNSSAPTAWIQLAGGTASNAAFRIDNGVAPTSPNNGDIWYDGANFYARVGTVGQNSPFGSTKPYTVSSTAVTLSSTNHYVEITAAVGVTLLDATTVVGRDFNIINAFTSAITVTANGTQTIGNASTAASTYSVPAGAALHIVSNGSNWRII